MKSNIMITLYSIFGIVLFGYLVGSFVAMDFNPANWVPAGRAVLATLIIFASAVVSACIFDT